MPRTPDRTGRASATQHGSRQQQADRFPQSSPYGDTRRHSPKTVSRSENLTDEQRDCTENRNEGTGVCAWCAEEYLGDAEMEGCARLCRDAADLASLHARFMARGSRYSPDLAETSADACEACAAECERHDAEHCQICADVLQECAESCRG